jgi:hypothetical protein
VADRIFSEQSIVLAQLNPTPARRRTRLNRKLACVTHSGR